MLIGSTPAPDEHLQLTGNEAGTPPGDRKFRPDVQGMRAIAIFLALVYHAGVPGFSGGYVGIEVFFVISGFVITGLLLREHESTGHTSLRSFYGRRVRRIMPAATLVIIVTVIAAYVLLGPLSGNQTANDGRWASVFLINIHFASNGTNYLSALLPPSVLENYWSLAVEEQFYIVYPTLFLLIGWWARNGSFRTRLTIILVAVIIASYVFSITDTFGDAQGAYFSLLTRAWELALGALIAVHGRHLQRIPQVWAAVGSWVGLTIIMVASVTLTGSSRYPGALVAIPTLAAGLIVAAGAAQPAWGVERLLRRRTFQFLAAISFPLYLWHWPILEIAAQRRGVARLPVWDNMLLLLVSGVLATLTYYFFENPIRHNRSLATRRWASLALGGCLIVSTLTFTTVMIHVHAQGALATPGLANLKTGDACPAPTKQELRTLMGTGPTTNHRIVARILLVGDSTACTMLPGLEAVGAPAGVQVEDGAVIGCGIVSGQIPPSIVNGVEDNTSRTCQSRANAAEARAIRSGRPDIVLWASTWERSALVVGSGKHRRVLTPGSRQWYAVLQKRIDERVRRFTATGATVVMLTQAPFAGVPGQQTPQDMDFERLNALLTQFASTHSKVKLVNLAARVCPSGPPCPLVVDGLSARGDGEHYTTEGSLWVARWLMPQLGITALDRPVAALPTIKILKPVNGAVLKGASPLVAVEAFNIGVANVDFVATGNSLRHAVIGDAVLTDGYWALDWNTNSVPDGTYTLRSVASNSAGDQSTSKAITVRVSN
jgi:peptidoglycan/LPS O-acetylase OafA/YrhL